MDSRESLIALRERVAKGAVFDVAYPFVREEVEFADVEGGRTALSWRPGTRYEEVPGSGNAYYDAPGVVSVADGIGTMRLSVVDTFHPKPFPSRVFYTREWVPPTGKPFGKRRLLMTTRGNFTALLRGYRHEFSLTSEGQTHG